MGQNSSAPARPPRVSANPTATATADGDVGVRATVHRDDEQQQQQEITRTKRRSLRNSLRALVPKARRDLNKRARPASMSFAPSASAGGDLEAIGGTQGRSGSRRWSRARRASSFVPPPASAPHEDGEVDEFGLLAAVADEAMHTDADPERDPHRLDEEADEEQVQVQVQPRERPATPMPPASSPPYSSSSASPSTAFPAFPAAPQSQSQVPQTPAPAEGGLGGPPPIPPETTHAPRAPQAAQHHTFPPPGTLVVVQGVVHATDVPPPRTSWTSHRRVPPGVLHRRNRAQVGVPVRRARARAASLRKPQTQAQMPSQRRRGGGRRCRCRGRERLARQAPTRSRAAASMCRGRCLRACLFLPSAFFSFVLLFFSSVFSPFLASAMTLSCTLFAAAFRVFSRFWERGLTLPCLWAQFRVPEFLDWRPVRLHDRSLRRGNRQWFSGRQIRLTLFGFPCAGLLTHGRGIHGEAFTFGGHSVFCAYFLSFFFAAYFPFFFKKLFLEAGMYFPPSSSLRSGFACAACCYVFFREWGGWKHEGQYQ